MRPYKMGQELIRTAAQFKQFLVIIDPKKQYQGNLMTLRDRRGQLYIYGQGNICKDKLPYFQGTNLLGRNPIKTAITIKDRSISQIHSKIICKNNTIKIVDMGSKNGVYLNNLQNPIDPNVEIQINTKQDVVYFAQIRCRFVPDQLRKENQEDTREVTFKVQPSSKNVIVQGEKKNVLGGKDGNEDGVRKQVTTKQKNEDNATSKDNKKTKKAEIDQKQKDRQKQQLLKAIIAQQQEIARQKQLQTKINQEKNKKQKEKEEEIKQKKQGKKKNKKESKQKSLEKINNKQQEKNVKKPNSKQKNKNVNEKQAVANENKKVDEKNEPNKQKQVNKASRKQVTQPIVEGRDANNENAIESKKQPKQKRAESGETKVKGAMKKKNKSAGKPDEKMPEKSKPPLARKKLPEALSETLSDYPRRSIIQKTALISGFTLTFKPSTKITIIDNWRQRFDVLVMEKYARTFKLLYSICLGIPVVTINWILESEHRRGIVPFQRFFLQAQEKDLLYSSVCKAKDGYKVFKDIQFYLVETEEKFHLPLQQIEILIQAGGGIVKKQLNKKNKDVIFIVKIDPTSQDMRALRKIQGCQKIYTVELILDSCLHQEIKWQQNKVKKN